MNELTKIKNVMKKVVPDAPNEVLLVLDGSTGQNAFEQAKQFTLATEVTAMAVTKLDGTAKGGVASAFQTSLKFRLNILDWVKEWKICRCSVKRNLLIHCSGRMHETEDYRYHHFRMF